MMEMNLIHLHTAATEFRHTVELYLFAHDRKLAGHPGDDDSWRMIAWINIAGRNGSMVAYGIQMAMQAINSVSAPTLRKMVDMNERSQGTKLFAAEFPNIAGIRTAAAHPGELSATQTQLDNHHLKATMVSGLGVFGAGSYVTGGMVAGDDHLIYSASFEGKPVEYELSVRKADVLEKIAQHYSRAFHPLENARSAAPREQMRQIDELRQQG